MTLTVAAAAAAALRHLSMHLSSDFSQRRRLNVTLGDLVVCGFISTSVCSNFVVTPPLLLLVHSTIIV